MFSGYSYNERTMLSLGVVDPEGRHRAGSSSYGAKKAAVRRNRRSNAHKQIEIRAIVSPVPYSEVARTSYAEGWRSKATAAEMTQAPFARIRRAACLACRAA